MKILGKSIGIGNNYKTASPFVVLARTINKKIDPKFDVEYDGFIVNWIKFGYSNSHVLGFPVHGDYKGQAIVKFIYDILSPVHDFFLKCKYCLFTRLHIVKLPVGKYTWCDADERMFHACFHILGRYVEEELGTENWYPEDKDCIYRGYRQHSVDNDKLLIDLWLWYKEELAVLVQQEKEWFDKKFGNLKCVFNKNNSVKFEGVNDMQPSVFDEHNYVERIKDEKLKELVNLRRTIWT